MVALNNDSHARENKLHCTKAWSAIAMVVLITAFYLLREHWAHVLGLWPYLILLLCPLMHLMHGHGKHDH
jgi:hypothetical protein